MEHPLEVLPPSLEVAERDYHMITVEDETDGRRLTLVASTSEKIGEIVDQLYERLDRRPLSGDRLRWESDDEDVTAFTELTLAEYFELGQCPRLRWVFVGPTGGDCA